MLILLSNIDLKHLTIIHICYFNVKENLYVYVNVATIPKCTKQNNPKRMSIIRRIIIIFLILDFFIDNSFNQSINNKEVNFLSKVKSDTSLANDINSFSLSSDNLKEKTLFTGDSIIKLIAFTTPGAYLFSSG